MTTHLKPDRGLVAILLQGMTERGGNRESESSRWTKGAG
jgi:hypothetical protein